MEILENKKMLKIRNLHVVVEDKHILKGVDLSVGPGEIHAIMGPNGSGKSTLAYALMGHPKYKVRMAGRGSKLELDGKSLIDKSPDERARMGLFLAFQYPASIEGVSVQNFLRKASESLANGPKSDEGKGGKSVLEFRRRLKEKARSLGVKEGLLKRSLNDQFSGGEKKRVEVLQLSVLNPKYAILDETDSGLDIDALRIVAHGIRQIVEQNKDMGALLITHYQRILQFIKPDFVHVMIAGKIADSGGKKLAAKIEEKGYKVYE